MKPEDHADEFPILVERRLFLVTDQASGRREVAVQIGAPYWIEEGIEAACPVAIRGLLGRVNDIRGLDLLDALGLAIRFVDLTLSEMKSTHQFFWQDGEPY